MTLFEDESGRVQVLHGRQDDPEIAELRAQVAGAQAGPGEQAVPAIRLDQIEQRLEKVDVIEAKVARVDELTAAAERLPELEAKVDALPDLQAQIGELGKLRTRLDRLERPG